MSAVRDVRETFERLHPVKGRAHDNLQDHAVVRHSALLVVVDIMLPPIPYHAEFLYVFAEVARHQRIQPHGEGAAISVSLGPAVEVSYFRI